MKRYYGVYRAQVIKNDDSKEDHPDYAAVQVKIPEIHGDDVPNDQLPWAYAAVPWGSGKNKDGFDYCSVNIPLVESWLWVMFEHGDVMRPVYFASWIGGEESELPEVFLKDERSETEYPDIRGWTFGFDGGSFSLRIVDNRRLEIFFDEHNIIEIDSKGDDPNKEKQICVRSEWLVRLKSEKEIKLEAPTITIEAESKLEMTSQGTAELGASGATKIRGAIISGSGTVTGSFKHPV